MVVVVDVVVVVVAVVAIVAIVVNTPRIDQDAESCGMASLQRRGNQRPRSSASTSSSSRKLGQVGLAEWAPACLPYYAY